MISDFAYAEGSNAAWGTFCKAGAFKPPTNVNVFRSARTGSPIGAAPLKGAAPAVGPVPQAAVPAAGAAAGAAAPQTAGVGVTKKPQLPAAPPAGAPPAAGAPAAGAPAGQPGLGQQIWDGVKGHLAGAAAPGAAGAAAAPPAAPANGGFLSNVMGGMKGDPASAGTWGHTLGGQLPGIGMAYAMSKLQGGGTPDNGLGG